MKIERGLASIIATKHAFTAFVLDSLLPKSFPSSGDSHYQVFPAIGICPLSLHIPSICLERFSFKVLQLPALPLSYRGIVFSVSPSGGRNDDKTHSSWGSFYHEGLGKSRIPDVGVCYSNNIRYSFLPFSLLFLSPCSSPVLRTIL